MTTQTLVGFVKDKKLGMLIVSSIVTAATLVASAVDLPWTYDTSGRTVVDVKSNSTASPAGAFVTMAGHWSYESTTSRIRSTPWTGITIVVF